MNLRNAGKIFGLIFFVFSIIWTVYFGCSLYESYEFYKLYGPFSTEYLVYLVALSSKLTTSALNILFSLLLILGAFKV